MKKKQEPNFMIDLKNYYRQCAVTLVASKIYSDYCFIVKNFDGFGPEMYVEQWLKSFLTTDDSTFKEDVCRIFISMLQEFGRNNG